MEFNDDKGRCIAIYGSNRDTYIQFGPMETDTERYVSEIKLNQKKIKLLIAALENRLEEVERENVFPA